MNGLSGAVAKSDADIVIYCKTFLDNSIPPTYGQIEGYTHWYRKDRYGQGSGIAMSHASPAHTMPQ